jgi:hypothetical protein
MNKKGIIYTDRRTPPRPASPRNHVARQRARLTALERGRFESKRIVDLYPPFGIPRHR